MHATLYATLSVGRSVGRSVGPSVAVHEARDLWRLALFLQGMSSNCHKQQVVSSLTKDMSIDLSDTVNATWSNTLIFSSSFSFDSLSVSPIVFLTFVSGASECTPCPRNTYSQRHSASCQKCNSKTEYSDAGSSKCETRPPCKEKGQHCRLVFTRWISLIAILLRF